MAICLTSQIPNSTNKWQESKQTKLDTSLFFPFPLDQWQFQWQLLPCMSSSIASETKGENKNSTLMDYLLLWLLFSPRTTVVIFYCNLWIRCDLQLQLSTSCAQGDCAAAAGDEPEESVRMISLRLVSSKPSSSLPNCSRDYLKAEMASWMLFIQLVAPVFIITKLKTNLLIYLFIYVEVEF